MFQEKIEQIFKEQPNILHTADEILTGGYDTDATIHDKTLRKVMQMCCLENLNLNNKSHVAYNTAERICFCSSLKVWWSFYTWLESVCLDHAVLYFSFFHNIIML